MEKLSDVDARHCSPRGISKHNRTRVRFYSLYDLLKPRVGSRKSFFVFLTVCRTTPGVPCYATAASCSTENSGCACTSTPKYCPGGLASGYTFTCPSAIRCARLYSCCERRNAAPLSLGVGFCVGPCGSCVPSRHANSASPSPAAREACRLGRGLCASTLRPTVKPRIAVATRLSLALRTFRRVAQRPLRSQID